MCSYLPRVLKWYSPYFISNLGLVYSTMICTNRIWINLEMHIFYQPSKACSSAVNKILIPWCLLRALLEMTVRTPQTLGSELWRGWDVKLEATDTMRSLAPKIDGGFCCLSGELSLHIGVPHRTKNKPNHWIIEVQAYIWTTAMTWNCLCFAMILCIGVHMLVSHH